MKIKLNDISIESNNPFINCKLEREKYAIILTEIIKKYDKGFVLSINNEWGAGKTTFIKMWQGYLEKQGTKTLYFNAWENDFESSPLIALLAELKEITGKDHKPYKNILQKGVKLTKSLIPTLTKAIAEKYVNIQVVSDAIEKIAEDSVELLKEEIDEYAEKKVGMKEFRKSLEAFVEKECDNKPLVFFIDELDRCKPSYAVEILEQIKHFFSVQGIVFVLSIDKKQLGNSIKGYYGNDNIDTDSYLKMFIDLEFKMPEPSYKEWVRYLYEYFDFNLFFGRDERKHQELKYDGENFKTIAGLVCSDFKFSLRSIEKYFAQSRVCLLQFKPNEYTFSHLLFILIVLKNSHPVFFENIINRKTTPESASQNLKSLILDNIQERSDIRTTYIEALFLHLYFNYYKEIYQSYKLLDDNTTIGKKNFVIGFSGYPDILIQHLDSFNSGFNNFSNLSIAFLTNKIDFTESIS